MDFNSQVQKLKLAIFLILNILISGFIVTLFFDTPIQTLINGSFAPLYTFLGSFSVFLVIGIILSIKFGTRSNGSKKYGDAQLLNPKQAKAIDKKEHKNLFNEKGILLSKDLRLSDKKSFEHVALIGPTGSGKSASAYIPNLLTLDANSSAVVTDPKGELAEKTAGELLKRGFQILILAPERKNTMGYNPLDNCRNEEEVIQVADIIMANGGKSMEEITGVKGGGTEWLQMGGNLFKAALIYEYRRGQKNIANAVDMLNGTDVESLDEIFSRDRYARDYWEIFMQSADSPKTAASIKSTVSNNTAIFKQNNVKKLTGDPDIKPEMLREKPTVLFIQYPEEKSAFYAPVMATIFFQLMSRIKEVKGRAVYFYLDEFANIGRIPGIEKLAATIRSRAMSLLVGIQSTSQLEQNYGRNEARVLLENLKTKIILPGLSGETAEMISKLAGNAEMDTHSISLSGNNSASASFSKTRRELLSQDEIRRMKDETTILIIENMNPILDHQVRYYKNADMAKATENEFDNDKFLKKYQVKKGI